VKIKADATVSSFPDFIKMEIEQCGDLNIEYDTTQPSIIPIRLIDLNKEEPQLGFRA
jgi:hypothetical protein